MKKIMEIVFILTLFFQVGCETTTSRPYSVSTQNVLLFQKSVGSLNGSVALGDFTESEDVGTLNCRLLGPIDVSPGKSKASYIREAMQAELFMAQVYDVESDIVLSGNLDDLSFSSVSPASWDITFSIASNYSDGYTVNANYPFKTSYSAYSACQNVADTFSLVVQKLIRDILEHPKFDELINREEIKE